MTEHGRARDGTRVSRRVVVAGTVVTVLAVVLGIGVLQATTHEPRDAGAPGNGSAPVTATDAPSTAPPAVPLSHAERLAPATGCGRGHGLGPPVPSHRSGRSDLRAFAAVAAVRCVFGQREYPDGTWSVQRLQVAVDGLPRLLDALDRPDGDPDDVDVCNADIEFPPDLALAATDGTFLRPRFPVDGCDHQVPQVRRAVDAMRWHTVRLVKVHLDVPADPVLRTCQGAWKNMALVSAADARVAGGSPGLAGAGIACVYRTGDDPMVGAYERGLRLDAAAVARLDAAVSGAGDRASCATPDEFAVVHLGNRELYVELDACGRVLRPDSTLGRADTDAVRAVLAG